MSKIILIIILFCYQFSFAGNLSSVSNARTFEQNDQSLVNKSLAFACFNSDFVIDDVPCSAQNLYKIKEPKLLIEGLLSNGYNNITKIYKLFSNDIDQSTVDTLFSDQPVLQTEGQIHLVFLSQYFSAKFTPAAFNYYSIARNEANPEVELKAVNYQSIQFSFGHKIDNISFGLDVNSTQWKFIKKDFYLFDLSTEEGKQILKPNSQSTLYVDPSVGYTIETFWPIQLSTKYSNLASQNKSYDDFKHKSEVQFGASLSPKLIYGKLSFLVDYKSLEYDASESEKIHFGTQYQFGAMNLQLGYDAYGISAGVFYGLNFINSGILFSSTQLPWEHKEEYAQTVTVQFGWQL